MTSQALFDYAVAYAQRHEIAGNGTRFPTVRACAKRFRVSHQKIRDVTSDGVDSGYLGLAVAIQAANGVSDLQLGDQLVEAFR